MTGKIRQLVESRSFHTTVLALIVLAAVLIGLETSRVVMGRFGSAIRTLDTIIIYLFALEAALKMAAHGKRWYRYFKDPWNVFDFIIVAACLLPIDGHHAAVLRLVRVFRALRLISALPKLQVLVSSLLKSLPSMLHVGMLLVVLFYIYAVLGVFLWRDNDPVHFRDLGVSLLSLFRVITLEDWTDIMYIQMKGSVGYEFTAAEQAIINAYPDYASKPQPVASVIYFVSFVLFGTMIMLNLVIGVIINSMNEATAEARALRNFARGQKAVDHDQKLAELETHLADAQQMLKRLREQSNQANN